MADQLTSVGVEFSKWEMSRIFYYVAPTAEVRPWGFGMINNPNGMTSYPDWIHSGVVAPLRMIQGKSTEYTTRTPGSYTADEDSTEPLINPREFVHPSVRLRYCYGGKTMDDKGAWGCRALIGRGFNLEAQPVPSKDDVASLRPTREPSATSTYPTVHGPVTPFYGPSLPNPPAGFTAQMEMKYVRAEQPCERDDMYELPAPKTQWVWVNQRDKKVLPEEHVGMWERMFMKSNDTLLVWQANEKRWKAEAAKKEMETTRANMWAIQRWGADTLGAAGTSINSTITSIFPSKPEPIRDLPEGMETEYGLNDMVSWQTADPPRPKKVVNGANRA
jgi:hypothetical protein